MNPYETMLEIMRKQGKKDQPEGLMLASVVGNFVEIGNLKLDSSDYYKADGIDFKNGDTVLVYQISDSKYIVLCKVVI